MTDDDFFCDHKTQPDLRAQLEAAEARITDLDFSLGAAEARIAELDERPTLEKVAEWKAQWTQEWRDKCARLERQRAEARNAVARCIAFFEDPRIGNWQYMESETFFSDLKTVKEEARLALKSRAAP